MHGIFDDLIDAAQRGTVIFLGLLCLLTFAANAAVLAWFLLKSRGGILVRCPKCGRTIVCPHCAEEET